MNIENLTPKEYLSHLEIFGTEKDRKTVSVLKFLFDQIEDLEEEITEANISIDVHEATVFSKENIINSLLKEARELKKQIKDLKDENQALTEKRDELEESLKFGRGIAG